MGDPLTYMDDLSQAIEHARGEVERLTEQAKEMQRQGHPAESEKAYIWAIGEVIPMLSKQEQINSMLLDKIERLEGGLDRDS